MLEELIKSGEVSQGKTSVKKTFYFIDVEKKIKVKSKEIFIKQNKIVHYPFRKDNGQSKYDTIKSITYKGFEKSLPRGILKDGNTGYGFTRILNPLLYHLQDKFKIQSVIVNNGSESTLDVKGKKVVFSFKHLDTLYPIIDNLFSKQKQESVHLISSLLFKLFPVDIQVVEKNYIKNSLYAFIEKYKEYHEEFSKEDVNSLLTLLKIVSKNHEITNQKVILKTKEAIEELFIEDVIKLFDELLKQKTETEQLEEKWQIFLKDNSWIFSQLLSFPVIVFEDKAYVGGKNIGNKNGKIADFLIQNNLTKNAAFIEIKTHRSSILKKGKAYRGSDVFSISDDLSGAINQVLDQRDNFQKEFYTLKANSKKPIETFNSKCIVIIGMIKGLNDEQLKSFELFRSNSKDVEIITFDELLSRLKVLHKLMMGK